MGFNSGFKGLNFKKVTCVCVRACMCVWACVCACVRACVCVCVSLNELSLQRQLFLMLRRTIGRHGHPIFQFRIPPSAFWAQMKCYLPRDFSCTAVPLLWLQFCVVLFTYMRRIYVDSRCVTDVVENVFYRRIFISEMWRTVEECEWWKFHLST